MEAEPGVQSGASKLRLGSGRGAITLYTNEMLRGQKQAAGSQSQAQGQ